jgi:hypothetical protein
VKTHLSAKYGFAVVNLFPEGQNISVSVALVFVLVGSAIEQVAYHPEQERLSHSIGQVIAPKPFYSLFHSFFHVVPPPGFRVGVD